MAKKNLMSPLSWFDQKKNELTAEVKKKNPFLLKGAIDTVQKEKAKKKKMLEEAGK